MSGETLLTVVGNLTADPEIRTTSSGGVVANLTIASTPRQYNQGSGQWEDGPGLFMRCSAWDTSYNPMASNIQASLTKGMRVIARGRLVQRSYEDREGNNRTVMELRLDEIGPALSRNTALVTRNQKIDDAQQRGGFAGASRNQASGFMGTGGPMQPAPGRIPPASPGNTTPEASAPSAAQDPWSQPPADEFGGDNHDEPEF